MKLKVISLLGMLVLTATMMFAHGDKKHVMGTLEKINADSVVVKQADGKSVEVKLVANTMYVTRDGKAAKVSDLAVGDRVVIHATPSGETLSADEIKFSVPAAAGAAKSLAQARFCVGRDCSRLFNNFSILEKDQAAAQCGRFFFVVRYVEDRNLMLGTP
jgi:hypothetical protein